MDLLLQPVQDLGWLVASIWCCRGGEFGPSACGRVQCDLISCLYEGDGSWHCCRESELAARICEHMDTLAFEKVAQYSSMLHKREYLPEEKAERQGQNKKRHRNGNEAVAADTSQLEPVVVQ